MPRHKKLTTFLISNALPISLLLHLLFLLSITRFSQTQHLSPQKSYYYYEPAYIYDGKTPPSPLATAQEKSHQPDKITQQQPAPDASAIPQKKIDTPKKVSSKEHPQTTNQAKHTTPLNMIGDELLKDTFRKLLGEAITSHLSYPNFAKELNLRGTAAVGFTIHRNGEITDVTLVKTSKERILDVAALRAVEDSSPLKSAEIYLKEDKYLVVNIIF